MGDDPVVDAYGYLSRIDYSRDDVESNHEAGQTIIFTEVLAILDYAGICNGYCHQMRSRARKYAANSDGIWIHKTNVKELSIVGLIVNKKSAQVARCLGYDSAFFINGVLIVDYRADWVSGLVEEDYVDADSIWPPTHRHLATADNKWNRRWTNDSNVAKEQQQRLITELLPDRFPTRIIRRRIICRFEPANSRLWRRNRATFRSKVINCNPTRACNEHGYAAS